MTQHLPDSSLVLRSTFGAASLLAEYGAALPPEVEAARALHTELRRARPGAPDLREIGALAIDDTPAKAGRTLTAAQVADEVWRASLAVAAERTRQALSDHSDDVISAVLTSPVLAEAVKEIAEVAPGVRADVPRNPEPDDTGSNIDDVIGAGRLRRAEAVIGKAATGLEANDALGVSFMPDTRGLLWIDPSGVTGQSDFEALRHALGGWRRGHSTHRPYVMQRNGSTAVPIPDPTPLGITSAGAAHVPGVVFAMASSWAEYSARLATFRAGLSAPTEPDSVGGKPRRSVVLF